MPEPIAIWNPARDAWERPQLAICGHLAVYSETWPPSGMTSGGRAYARPKSGPHTGVSESLLLPTPSPFHAKNTERPTEWAARRKDVQDRTGTQHGPPLQVIVWSLAEGRPLVPGHYREAALLPTPTAQDGANTAGPSQSRRNSLPLNTAVTKLPAVGVRDELDPPGEQLAIPMPGDAELVQWGPYGDAIRRWEDVLGRSAPPPLEDGKLSARFTEWVMGLPDGWVTDVPGLTRNAMLRMLGNGVVPQQAAAAISLTRLGVVLGVSA